VVVRLTRGIASLFKKHGIALVTGTGRLAAAGSAPPQVVAAPPRGNRP